MPTTPAEKLSALLQGPDILRMPCCFDPLSAKLVEQAEFELSFMSGFAVSATRLAAPDTGLISYAEMLDQGRSICSAVNIPIIGDADTGYGNPANVRRTVQGYAAAGFAGVMIEDQLAPKRCGHTGVKEVVSRSEALQRVRAACDARDEGAGILVMARTDARNSDGLDEALWRIQAFRDAGADMLFMEAPRDEREMAAFCEATPGPKLANMLEEGLTPILSPEELQNIGYKLAAYPLSLLNSAVFAMREALQALKRGETPSARVDFQTIRRIVGFDEYDRLLERYADEP